MTNLVVPALGESITEAIIGKWLVGVGEHADADEPVVDLETDKITVQLPAPVSGVLREQRFSVGDTVRVGDVIGQIEEGAAGARPAKASEPTTGTTASSGGPKLPERDSSGRLLSPSQRRSLRASTAELPQTSSAPEQGDAQRPAPVAAPGADPREQVVPMSPLRQRIAERLVQAQQSSASLTTFNEVDMSEILRLRTQFKEEFAAAHGVKLGFMSFVVKASVAALSRFPGLNAEVRGDSIVYKHHYDIGIAVSTERGLVVPVLRDADRLSFADIELGIAELATRARDSKLVIADLMGGTFSITNGGIYGSMMSTPVLNYPQTGILGMHNIVERPVAVDGQVVVRPVMYLALTYDHRVVDGKEAVQFLVAVKRGMENPDRLLFEV